ncbi:hypothetical protein BD413DRAFT_463255, partial [Trametes elegans]
MDVQSVQTVSAVRRPGNVNHPAHMPRHVVYIQETQDPEVQQAAAEFAAMVSHTTAGVQKRSAKKAGKMGHNTLENVKPCAESTLQRRHTSEDVQPTPRISAQRKVAKTHSADPKAGRNRKRLRQDAPMDEDEPIAGPSKSVMYTIFKPVPGVSFGDDEDEEEADGGMPSST